MLEVTADAVTQVIRITQNKGKNDESALTLYPTSVSALCAQLMMAAAALGIGIDYPVKRGEPIKMQ